MKIASHVRFDRVGENTYLRNIATRRDYLFNGIAYDILDYVRAHPGCDEDAICRHLLGLYDVEAEATFRADIAGFAMMLLQEGLLYEDTPSADDEANGDEGSVLAAVEGICIAEQRAFYACLELTHRCNERCVHCYVGDARPDEELTVDEYRRLLDTLREMGCMQVLLTGGEVCVKEGFAEIARHAAGLGMLVDIFTNGIGLTDALFDEIAAIGPNSLSYSLYAGDAATHDAVTQVKGSFERTLHAVMMTKCAGIDTYIKTVVMRENVDGLEGLFKLGRRLGVTVATAYAVLDTLDGRSGAPHRLQSAEAYRGAMEMAQRYYPRAYGRRDKKKDAMLCNAGLCSLSVDPYGEVYPCVNLLMPLGNIRKCDIRDIWENAPALARLRALRFGDVCKRAEDCAQADFCEICLAVARYNGSTDEACIPEEICMIATELGGIACVAERRGVE